MARMIDRIIAILFFIIAILLIWLTDWRENWYWIIIAILGAVVHIWLSKQQSYEKREKTLDLWENTIVPKSALTELVLLSEDNTKIASWNLYGKNGLVIGRDVGENSVDVNLNDVTYASMINIEHAVLNYSGGNWYVEDISEKNGVSIEKRDGRKYKLSYGKPCKIERGDILYIALTRLQIL